MIQKTRIVFFVRSYNDIDHIAPLVHYCGLKEDIQPEVYCLDWNYSLFKNPNIQFLIEKSSIQIEQLWGPRSSSLRCILVSRAIDLVRWLESHLKDRAGASSLSSALLGRTRISLSMLATGFYRLLPIEKIFRNTIPKALVFDYLNAGASRNRSIVARANQLKIPTFCVPHGILIYSNKYITRNRDLVVDSGGLFFDHYLGGGLVSDYLKWRGIPPKRITEVGSLRFCPEWIEIRQRSIFPRNAPKVIRKTGSCTVNIVFFLHQLVYNTDPEKLKVAIKCLTEVEGIQVRIKPHTRGMKIPELVELLKSSKNIKIVPNIESADLIEWCDVAISTGSSIILDALLAGKIFLYPDFIDSNRIFFQKNNACWTVSTAQEFRRAVESLVKDKTKIPYSLTDQVELLNRLIFASESKRDVRQQHLKLLLESRKASL